MTVAGSALSLVSSSDTRGELSVGCLWIAVGSCPELELCQGLFGSLGDHS